MRSRQGSIASTRAGGCHGRPARERRLAPHLRPRASTGQCTSQAKPRPRPRTTALMTAPQHTRPRQRSETGERRARRARRARDGGDGRYSWFPEQDSADLPETPATRLACTTDALRGRRGALRAGAPQGPTRETRLDRQPLHNHYGFALPEELALLRDQLRAACTENGRGLPVPHHTVILVGVSFAEPRPVMPSAAQTGSERGE